MMRAITFLLILISLTAKGQNKKLIQATFDNASIHDVFKSIQDQSGYNIYFEDSRLDSLTFSGVLNQISLDSALQVVLSPIPLNYYISDQAVFITNGVKIIDQLAISNSNLGVKKIDKQPQVEKGLLFTREYLNLNSTGNDKYGVIEIGNRQKLISGGKSIVAGYVKDKETGESLTGVVVFSKDPKVATITDQNGFYSLNLPNGKVTLNIQYVGMKSTQRNIVLFSDGQLNINMLVDVIALQEVMIESESDANVQNVLIGVSKIDVEETKNVPIVMGESDIMKIATTFAGVQTVGEGASGFNVRGGKSDQNLIMLNGATIYNASHFFGFFSVFNSNAIHDMEIYKSGIPSNFGGRLSSVFDIESKRADDQAFKGEGGISPITAKLTLEIPIVKGKSSLMIAGRTTYSNWLLRKIGNAEYKENKVFFADAILRYDHKINDKNSLEISGYYSKDKFRISSDTIFSFSNFSYINGNGSVKWNHRFNDQLDGHLSAVYSGYKYELTYDESPANSFFQDFSIEEYALNTGLAYHVDDVHTFRTGAEIKSYSINPGSKGPATIESFASEQSIDKEHALETTFHLSDQYIISDKLTFYAGYRYSFFANFGPQTVYNYQNDAPKNSDTVTDSVAYNSGDAIQTYHGGEIRASLRLTLDDQSSIKASYNKTRQYIHTLSNSASLSPTDTWRVSSTYLKPQIADQYALGYYRNFKSNMIETSVEFYYKKMENLIDFKIGSQFLLNKTIETATLQGPGKSYGVEFSIKKTGQLNGWLNYSYARSFIKLDSFHPEETVNDGNYYPTNFDKPHTINLVANYKFTKRWSFSTNFTFNTGRPVTYPVGAFNFKGTQVVHYSDRNSFRIPDYMRLDIGINLEASHRLAKLTHSYWSFSVYNLLGRDNPFSVFFDIQDGKVNGYKLVVFPTPIPTISYNFRF